IMSNRYTRQVSRSHLPRRAGAGRAPFAIHCATVVTQMPKPITTPRTIPRATPVPSARPRRWLILVHQLPPLPSNLRVRTWRRLQALGAVAVKQSVYVLPDTPESRED